MTNTSDTKMKSKVDTKSPPTIPDAPPALLDYYSAPKSEPSAFLRAWGKVRDKSFSENDRRSIIEQLSKLDPLFDRTLGLASKAFAKPSASILCFPWIGIVIQRVLSIDKGWTYDSTLTASETFEEIIRHLRPDLFLAKKQTKNEYALAAKRADRSARILLAAMLWLSHSRQLSYADAIKALRGVLGGRLDEAERQKQRERDAFNYLARSKISLNKLRSVYKLLSPWLDRTQVLEAEIAQNDAQLETLLKARDAAIEISKVHAERITHLQKEIDRLNQDIGQLREENAGLHISGRHGRMEIIARERGVLSGKLRPLLESVMEAAKMVPPRTQVVVERVELAIEAIAKEEEWLRSSD